MEDPKNSLQTVSAQTYDRNLTDKLYEISSNVNPLQLQNIIDDNIKIENENNLNVPSSSSSSFSDLDSFKEEDKLPENMKMKVEVRVKLILQLQVNLRYSQKIRIH
jgi:hypothetical protein